MTSRQIFNLLNSIVTPSLIVLNILHAGPYLQEKTLVCISSQHQTKNIFTFRKLVLLTKYSNDKQPQTYSKNNRRYYPISPPF
ncbi:hypothetical protein BN2497_445 [Janthinobacterium sp. CG23_2]|nr:hypothetical protein BN2497_445 [Janthinobacterium sp. CG23_2]CUU26620.1 hypothetical protein BN3177_445 [Janthinobacterium sp. CG23_2]